MNKTLLIIQREYLTRVRKKSFVMMTLLTPLLMIALISMPAWLNKTDDTVTKEIIVIDQTGKQESILLADETNPDEPALITGMATAILIYFFILVYGTMVMRGVVEEKTNRIVEIIISSVKPVELMVGKIVGIALVGLTQFSIWAIILVLLSGFTGISTVHSLIPALPAASAIEIIFFFIVYFLGGYFLYAALFAAIGAMSDTETDTQQFMLPILLPVVFAMLVAVNSASNPDGQLAFWTSLIPFTSPIVMMIRIPAGNVPAWELILSVSLLLFSFAGTTWMAAKIYRTGILMYGKKVTYREIWKWIRYK